MTFKKSVGLARLYRPRSLQRRRSRRPAVWLWPMLSTAIHALFFLSPSLPSTSSTGRYTSPLAPGPEKQISSFSTDAAALRLLGRKHDAVVSASPRETQIDLRWTSLPKQQLNASLSIRSPPRQKTYDVHLKTHWKVRMDFLIVTIELFP